MRACVLLKTYRQSGGLPCPSHTEPSQDAGRKDVRFQLIGREVTLCIDFETLRRQNIDADLFDGIAEKYFHSALLVSKLELDLSGINSSQIMG